MSDAGVDDSAILLMSLGQEEAAEVFKFLSPKEAQKLGAAMAKVSNVSKEKVDAVLSRFEEEADEQAPIGLDSDQYIRGVLTKALGEDKAKFLLDRILTNSDTSGIESLKWMDAKSVAELIKNEHPQIIASILVHLERDQAAAILNEMVERSRNDVVLRIATLDGIHPSALRELNDVIAKSLSGTDQIKKAAMGGVRTAAEILNFVGSSSEGTIIEAVRAVDETIAQSIMDEMFVFDNLIDVDDRGIQALLKEVQSESLVLALKGAAPELREKVFANMSTRAAEMLREDLEARGPVRVSDVEAEQKEILKTARRLADEGQIVLGGKGDDSFI
ncbi:MAG TPA: flagellar motor switch protein FliG [Burkholderiales bacterium]|jgi:flagellar motor switch protein FliG|nr:flagellar motor switch protein FliG [Burkholderiales bacterium]